MNTKMTRAVATTIALLGVSLSACGGDPNEPELSRPVAETPAGNEERRERRPVPAPADAPYPDQSPESPLSVEIDGHDLAGHDGHGANSAAAEGARRIAVTATNLAFEPDEISVAAGEDAAIVLSSTDVLHDFTIDELGAHVGAEAGETGAGGFKADRPGRYTFYCSVAGHREAGMEGTLVVTG